MEQATVGDTNLNITAMKWWKENWFVYTAVYYSLQNGCFGNILVMFCLSESFFSESLTEKAKVGI